MPRRRIPRLPIEGLVDSPEALTLPAAGFGMLCRLTLHFWQTECRPLPIADQELRAISRAHSPTWRHWKPSILKVFEALRPGLETAWRARENRRDNLIRLSQRSASMRRANALRSKANTPNAPQSLFPQRNPPRQQQPAPAGKPQGGFRDR